MIAFMKLQKYNEDNIETAYNSQRFCNMKM